MGSYLYYDTVTNKHIHSGFAVRPDGLASCKTEHSKRSDASVMQSFMSFPIDSDTVGTLLHWSLKTKQALQNSTWYVTESSLQSDVLSQKRCAQRKMAAYLFALTGELLLGTAHGSSESAGFEGPLTHG
jgi:hypothetical protein